MKYNLVINQVPQISLCRKGAWLNSGLPSALKRSFRNKFGLSFEVSDGQNLSSTKDSFYKHYVNTLFNHEPHGFIFKNNYLPGVPKIVFLESEACLSEVMESSYWDDIIGFLSYSNKETFISNKPVFQNSDIERISDFLFNYTKKSVTSRPLYGLALVGGKSQRMKRDKGSLDYFGKAQGHHVYDLLNEFCDKTYISLREEQSDLSYLNGLEDHCLSDRFLNMGPLGGLLTAFQKHPEASWLVLACDLPYISKENLESLIKGRNYFKKATCFKNPEKGWPEPLCTIYEPSTVKVFHQYLSLGVVCPRKVLMNMPHELLEVTSDLTLQNINTPEGYEEVKSQTKLKVFENEGNC
tara:strand:+ start:2575 stop:3633 length:1059 start_codon:yes stop_codon:yes gene_type:complete